MVVEKNVKRAVADKQCGDKHVTLRELREKAKSLNVSGYSKMKKANLIWTVQKVEGNNDCFLKIPTCTAMDCCFRYYCIQ
jgi:hypothetical protein